MSTVAFKPNHLAVFGAAAAGGAGGQPPRRPNFNPKPLDDDGDLELNHQEEEGVSARNEDNDSPDDAAEEGFQERRRAGGGAFPPNSLPNHPLKHRKDSIRQKKQREKNKKSKTEKRTYLKEPDMFDWRVRAGLWLMGTTPEKIRVKVKEQERKRERGSEHDEE
jgi:hypothetical protein